MSKLWPEKEQGLEKKNQKTPSTHTNPNSFFTPNSSIEDPKQKHNTKKHKIEEGNLKP